MEPEITPIHANEVYLYKAYEQLLDLYKHEDDLKIKRMTLFLIGQSLLVGFLARIASEPDKSIFLLLAVATGSCIICVLWLFVAVRQYLYVTARQQQAVAIEKKLGLVPIFDRESEFLTGHSSNDQDDYNWFTSSQCSLDAFFEKNPKWLYSIVKNMGCGKLSSGHVEVLLPLSLLLINIVIVLYVVC